MARSSFFLSAVVIAVAFGVAAAHCPNKCSGHGVCRAHQRCTCYSTWMGADCSLRQCPYSIAWNDVAYGDDDAHFYAECSNAGVCDRSTGECTCNDGYEGDACRRLACPDACSGHGVCETTEEWGAKSSVGNFYSNTGSQIDKGVMQGKNRYGHWDAKKTQSCKCDPGWSGINCASRVCPYGNDPLTTESKDGLTEKHEVQTIYMGPFDTSVAPDENDDVDKRGYFSLSYTDNHGKVWTTRPIRQPGVTEGIANDATTNMEIRAALRSLPNHVIDDVEVSYDIDDVYYVYRVTFNSAATQGNQHLLKCNFEGCAKDGCQPRLNGLQGTTDDGAKCLVLGWENKNHADIGSLAITSNNMVAGSNDGTGENVQCSNRGICDGSTGLCECFEGFTGEACSIQTILV